MFDVRWGARLQVALTGLVVALIAFFIAGALVSGRGDAAHLATTLPRAAGEAGGALATLGGLALGLVYVSYAYFGWNAAAYVAGEMKEPGRSLPLALVAGTGLCTLVYVALNLVFLWAVPPAALAGKIEVAGVAAAALFGARGATLLSGLLALALAGSVSAFLMSGPRITVAMARDGVFFRALGRTGASGAPAAAVALQGALAAAAALGAGFDRIVVYVGFTLTLSTGATVAAAFVLRRRQPAAARPYRALAWPWSGLVFLALSAFMVAFAVHERPYESAAGLATLLAGGAAYGVWRRRSRPRPP
jgi:APA family basic amino acid/polyamine antiporter